MPDALADRFFRRCLTFDQASAEIDVVRDRLAVADWSTTIGSPVGAGRPYAVATPDEASRQIIIVGAPAPGAP